MASGAGRGAARGGNAVVDSAADSTRRIQDSVRAVEENAFHMNKAIEVGDLDEALKSAAKMLRELRVSTLSPKAYYELWMKVFDKLRQLHASFMDLSSKGVSMAGIYQKVQGTSHIIPRLYLMITAGSAIILAKEAATKDVLQDLIEMSKGVQHPLRGLFLRNYLLKMTQDRLCKEYDVDLEYAMNYVLQNFGEMNRLWVRMKSQASARDISRREKERQDLKVLISFNLVQLSEFEGLTLQVYSSAMLDRILDLVTSCKDRLAQQYLLDVIVQVFPASFHEGTITKLLEAFEFLEPAVNIKAILISLMDRIKAENSNEDDYVIEENGGIDAPDTSQAGGKKTSPNIFNQLNTSIAKIASEREDMKAEDVLDLQVALLDFAVASFPGEVSYIDTILEYCTTVLDKSTAAQGIDNSDTLDAILVQLLRVPLKQKDLSALELLGLKHFPAIMSRLKSPNVERVAHALLLHVLRDKELKISSVKHASSLFEFIAPLVIQASPKQVAEEGENPPQVPSASFEKQQSAVAKFIHRLDSPNNSTLFEILGVARKQFYKGGPQRKPFTLVPLCFRYLALAQRLQTQQQTVSPPESPNAGGEIATEEPEAESEVGTEKQDHTKAEDGSDQDLDPERKVEEATATEEEQGKETKQDTDHITLHRVFQALHEVASILANEIGSQERALQLFLQAAAAADKADMQEVAYEFFVQAFTLYEDVADSKEQIRLLPLLIGTLQATHVFDKDGFETLSTKTTQYAIRLLKKTDQCKMVCMCAHLYWTKPASEGSNGGDTTKQLPGRDPQRALDCLDRGLKIANSTMGTSLHVTMFLDILNKYIYFFVSGMDIMEAAKINDLIKVIKSRIGDIDDSSGDRLALEASYSNTVSYLKRLKLENSSDDRLAELAL